MCSGPEGRKPERTRSVAANLGFPLREPSLDADRSEDGSLPGNETPV